jgi:hypothetical protein
MRTRRRIWALTVGVWAALAMVAPATHGAGGPLRADAPSSGSDELAAAVERLDAAGPGRWIRGNDVSNLKVLAHHDLGGGGFNADVWVHGTTAYVGVWGRDPAQDIACPASGVKVIDIGDPTAPTLLGVLQNPELTTGEDVVVRSVSTLSFTGDLAVVGIQACGGYRDVLRGLQFFDVTDPASPVELGTWDAVHPTIGCHEVDLSVTAAGRVLAGCSIPFAEQYDAGVPVVIVDATDPTTPVKVGTYTNPVEAGVGCVSATLAHSVRFAGGGRRMYVSYWDAGTIELDVTDPSHPVEVARTEIAPPDEDANNHSLTEVSGRWLIINPEDFSPDDCGEEYGGWGEAWLYERRNGPTRLRGTFATQNSQSTRTDGVYTVHNTEVWGGTQAFSSWYSDGIRWWEFESTGRTRARGWFVPPATPDPNGYWPAVPLVWGVALQPQHDLVLASDINSGLWILRPIGLE